MKRAMVIVLPALLALGLAACDRPMKTADKSDPASGAIATRPSADATLSEKVRQALVTERGINARDLRVTAQNGVVTLSGKVEEKSDRERMMLVAMSVEGVRSVVSNLVVERPA